MLMQRYLYLIKNQKKETFTYILQTHTKVLNIYKENLKTSSLFFCNFTKRYSILSDRQMYLICHEPCSNN